MMETVLNIGLNDAACVGLARQQRRRAVRVGLLPAAALRCSGRRCSACTSDVFEDGARPPEGRRAAPRPTSTSTADDLRELVRAYKAAHPRARRPRLPAGPARAAGPGGPRGLRLVERRAGDALPPPRAHPRRPRHRGQRRRHGVRQPRRRLRHRRGLHPRPGHRRPGRLRRLPAERAGRGRRRRHPQHRAAADLETIDKPSFDELHAASWRRWSATTATCATSSSPSSAAGSGCCRPGSASAPPRPRSASPSQLVDEGLIDLDEALQRVTGAQLADADVPAVRQPARAPRRSPRA